uniref:Uncharacterized protein n=1 Tax=Arundo donax TaxID=35708 RepID=A0A0A9EX33_ARUDO
MPKPKPAPTPTIKAVAKTLQGPARRSKEEGGERSERTGQERAERFRLPDP